MNRKEVLQRMYTESAVIINAHKHSSERLQQAEQRLQNAKQIAKDNQLSIAQSILDNCNKANARECNALVAQKLNIQPTP